jgi:tetratricopeptide (TPR) repeat protein
MSIGLGGITAFLSLKLLQLVREPAVRVQNLELKSAGRLRTPGRWFACLTVLWLVFTSHSAFAQWHRAWGRHYLNQTEVSRADGLSGAFRAKHYSDRHQRALNETFRHFQLADRWGLAGVVEVKTGLAWCYVLRDDLAHAKREAEEAIALAPNEPTLRQNLLDIGRAGAGSPEDRFQRGSTLAESGRLAEAAVEFQAAVDGAPDSAPARFNYGGVLRRLGRNQEAIEQLAAARRLTPDDPEVLIELGLAYQATGANDRAVEAFKRAIALSPDSPESKLHLPGLIEQLERTSPPAAPKADAHEDR